LCFGTDDELPLIFCNQIHFVNETEYLGLGRGLEDGVQAFLVVVQIRVGLTALHVEHVNQHLNVPENIVTL